MELFIRPAISILSRAYLKYELNNGTEYSVDMNYLRSCIYVRPGNLLVYDNWYSAILSTATFDAPVTKVINNGYQKYTKNYVALFHSFLYGHILICGRCPKDIRIISTKTKWDILIGFLVMFTMHRFTGHLSIVRLLLDSI